MVLMMKVQNLQQKNGILLIVNQKVIIQNADAEKKFLTRSIESSLCDYSDAYILVTGSIRITRGNQTTKVALENCAMFKKRRTEINEIFVDDAQYINIAMPMYNLIEFRKFMAIEKRRNRGK